MAPAATASPGLSDILTRWRDPLGLVPDDPADPAAEWRGPCPKCKTPRALTVTPGHTRPVVSCIHCGCDPAAVHVILKSYIPGAPRPGKAKHPGSKHGPSAPTPVVDPAGELAALKARIRALVLNPELTGKAKDLALLQATGDDAAAALDVLGVKDKGNRSRYQTQVRRALALSPARVVKSDNRRRSKATTPRPAEIVKSDNSLQLTEQPLTCGNTGLTERATIVLAPEGSGHHTDTDTVLDLLSQQLGAQVISEEPRTSPLLVADAVDAWMPASEGPCYRCGTRTAIYGDHGHPLCADCRTPALVPAPRPGSVLR